MSEPSAKAMKRAWEVLPKFCRCMIPQEPRVLCIDHERIARALDAYAAEVAQERDALAELRAWILRKLRGMRLYAPPTDNRSDTSEIHGWMHVLCADHQTVNDVLPELDRRGREIAALRAVVEAKDAALREMLGVYYIYGPRWLVERLEAALAFTPTSTK